MAIDFDRFNKEFGGKAAVDAVKKAKENEYTEVPDGTYICTLDKMELGESQKGRPKVSAQFRIKEGQHKKQCLFYNGAMAADNPEYNGWMISKVEDFLTSLDIFPEEDCKFSGDYEEFNNLLLDMAEESESLKFEVLKSTTVGKNGRSYSQLEITDTFDR